MERFKSAIEGTDYSPLYELLRQVRDFGADTPVERSSETEGKQSRDKGRQAGRQAGNAMLSEAECGSNGKLKGRRERCANGACRSNLLHSCPPRTWPYQRHCLNPESSLKCPSVAVLLDDKGVRPKSSRAGA